MAIVEVIFRYNLAVIRPLAMSMSLSGAKPIWASTWGSQSTDILRLNLDQLDLLLHKDFVEMIVPVILEEAFAINTERQCKQGVTFIDSKTYCSVVHEA
jgi:hypothetical protein